MANPKLTLAEHNYFSKHGVLPESYKQRRAKILSAEKAQAAIEDDGKQPEQADQVDMSGTVSDTEAQAVIDDPETSDQSPEDAIEEEQGEEVAPQEDQESSEEAEDNDFDALPDDTEFPYNYGGSMYFLSDGTKVRGEKAAEKAQAALNEGG